MAEPQKPLRCSSVHSRDSTGCPIEGMKSVIATVSGYHGIERLNLVKLISHAGASYVGAMSSSITHLVCWKFEGRKYGIAMNSETIVVNHRWIEDCIKQGKRVPERPYTFKCGQEVGPLLSEVPQVPKVGASVKKQKVLYDKSNTCYGSEKKRGYMGVEASGDVVCNRSLLNQTLFCDVNKVGNSSHKSKDELVKSTSGQEHPISRPLKNPHEGTSSHASLELVRRKGKIINNNGSNEPETSRRRRRLVKKSTHSDILDLFPSGSNQDCYPIEVDNLNQNNEDVVVLLSNPLDAAMCANVSDNGRPSIDGFFNPKESRNKGLDSVEADVPSRFCASMDPNEPDVHAENGLMDLENTSEDGCSDAENSKEETTKGLEIKHDSTIPSSTELSCVICLTDFSSTRGVLPCGHRFCYSCIESWADHMALKRKISTCPLCKESFASIIKFEDTATDGQKIYSQTIPCGLSMMDMFILHDQETANMTAQHDSATVCSVCRRLEPVDLLIICNVCQIRRIHSYCLDPPVDPWTCIDCKDLQRLLPLSR
ncbi:uncharacterized protein LOC21393009 [Morus notabilis]|uniref:uncharacterized protein LOC21393009 n=1 Tax=Morus notabilis TaxID=981085 RepID=UPI000CED307C|nr:uncharacterized protein LOC21393009 [Morus notabilis]